MSENQMPPPVAKAVDVESVRFSAPDLPRMQAFLEDFGMRAAQDAEDDVLRMRGTGPAAFLHETVEGEPGFVSIAITMRGMDDLEALAALEGAKIEAAAGPGGGYRLARSPDSIRISVVMEAVEENVDAMHSGAGASGGVSGSRAQSLTNRLWEGLSAHVYVFLHQTRLSDVIGNAMTPCPAVPALFRVVDVVDE